MAMEIPDNPQQPIPLSLWKDLKAMRDWWKRTFAFGGADRPPPFTRPTDLVKVRNDSYQDLEVGHVLELLDKSTAAIDDAIPAWMAGNIYAGVKSCFAILIGPVAAKECCRDGKYVTAQTSGICVAILDIADTKHTHAGPVVGSVKLRSVVNGPVEILWQPGTTGEHLCLVHVN